MENKLLMVVHKVEEQLFVQTQTKIALVGVDTKMTLHTTPPNPLHPNQTKSWKPSGASDEHLLTTTKYNAISNKKQAQQQH